jgi:class 3 adenylate cyclase
VLGELPEVRYADAGGVAIAYAVRGDGPLDLVRVPALMNTIAASVVDPVWLEHWEQLTRFSRSVLLDRRGTGLSDPVAAGEVPLLEQQVCDVMAVMDAIGIEKAALSGGGAGANVAMLCAAMHPSRVSSLVLENVQGRHWTRAAGSNLSVEPAALRAGIANVRAKWGNVDEPWAYEYLAPSRLGDPTFRRILAQVQQLSASPTTAVAASLMNVDVESVLPLVQAPTLVMCGEDTRGARHGFLREWADYLVARIADARLATWPGCDKVLGDQGPRVAALIEEFLTGVPTTEVSNRVLATVLFTDIVASTERLREVGDQQWRRTLDSYDALVRSQLRRHRGRLINTAGDGFFATFDGPARAVQCASDIITAADAANLEIRAGVHVGECELRGDDLAGIAVHIGARVCALAGPGEILTTTTVRDLVTGSGIQFDDRGTHTLKGVDGEWPLLAAIT